MSATLPVAAVQMVSAATVAPNLEAAAALIARAAADGARLVVLPENMKRNLEMMGGLVCSEQVMQSYTKPIQRRLLLR